MLYNVIQEVAAIAPRDPNLVEARLKLGDHQDEAKLRLTRLAKNRNPRELAYMLDRARHMGIPNTELYWVEHHLRVLEETPLGARAGVVPPGGATGATQFSNNPSPPAGDSTEVSSS